MRKVYKKPSIYIESLELDTAICSCGVGANGGTSFGKPKHASAETCVYFNDVSNIGMFVGDVCKDLDPNDGIIYISYPKEADGAIYCYHQPTDTEKVIFAS